MTVINRRMFVASVALASLPHRPLLAQPASGFRFPIGWPGQAPLDGFEIRHGFQTENTWYNPGWWHTGEDYYAIDEDTGGAEVYAIGPGEVVFASYDYPGRVVIIDHGDDLVSSYGHLDYDLDVDVGDTVDTGTVLGRVLPQESGRAPSHLHFETRTFVTTTEVNGSDPRYGVNCGVDCPPGPGYWPIDAPELPVSMGWLNPTHVIGSRLAAPPDLVVATSAPDAIDVLDGPDGATIDSLSIAAGDTFVCEEVVAGDPATSRTSAEGTGLWYRIDAGWVAALTPSDRDTGSDGRPSALQFVLIPA
jgi:murein DD-endopeptidase MepM/ murein hydrolase activator NlpD